MPLLTCISGANPEAIKAFQPIIAVPARNEASRLPQLFSALCAQSWLRLDRRLRVILVINNSDDGSFCAAKKLAEAHPRLELLASEIVLPQPLAHVGSARRLAGDQALQLLGPSENGVILMTDADSRPDSGWIEHSLTAIAAGAHVVSGEIFGDQEEEIRLGSGFLKRAQLRKRFDHLSDHLACLIDPDPSDPWPRHRDHTGASLAVRADWLARVGGVPALPSREDLALVSALQREGAVLRHAPDVKVIVSARLDGRAPGGMAACLRQWVLEEQNGDPLLVEQPAALVERLQRRALVRALPTFGESQRLEVCRELGCPPLEVARLLADGLNGGALVERFAPTPTDPLETAPVERAISELEALISRHAGGQIAQAY